MQGTSYFITIPKEIREEMGLNSNMVAELEFNEKDNSIFILFKENIEDSKLLLNENIYQRKVMNINQQLLITLPIKKVQELDINENDFIDIDGNIEKKVLNIKLIGKDISTIKEEQINNKREKI